MYYKLFKKSEIHNGYQFKDGFNVDPNPWQADKDLAPGGFHFCEEDDIWIWSTLYEDSDDPIGWVRTVELPTDALCLKGRYKLKADKIILGPRVAFDTYILQNQEKIINSVKKNFEVLKFVLEQTPEICLKVVKESGFALKHVLVQTPEICLAAVRQDGSALQFVKEQTPELCLEAVKECGLALRYVKQQTHEICSAAIKNHPYAIHFADEDIY